MIASGEFQKLLPEEEDLNTRLKKLINRHKMMLFMKVIGINIRVIHLPQNADFQGFWLESYKIKDANLIHLIFYKMKKSAKD